MFPHTWKNQPFPKVTIEEQKDKESGNVCTVYLSVFVWFGGNIRSGGAQENPSLFLKRDNSFYFLTLHSKSDTGLNLYGFVQSCTIYNYYSGIFGAFLAQTSVTPLNPLKNTCE